METRSSPFSNNEEDRISNLPDTLIHQILSFIDMNYAVQTSVLSRRWRYLWTSIPTLNFDSNLLQLPETRYTNVEAFIDFVDRVLMLRDSSDIQRFNLHFFGTEDADYDSTSRVNTWILAAVRRNVQELLLRVSLWEYQTFQFPPSLFTCKSLTKLELSLGDMSESEFIPPKSMDLPMLKSLELCGVSIYDEKFTDMLFSSCPVLESLIIKDCRLNLNNISTLKLKHFKLEYEYYDSEDSVVKTLKLYAPNLTSFICKSYMSHDYALENLSSLVTADIHLMVEDEEEDETSVTYSTLSVEVKQLYAQNIMKLLRALHTVKDLTLSPSLLEVVSGAPNLLDSQPPQFCNLRCLMLGTFLSRDCFPAITYLFRISPNMESLYLIIKKCSDEPQMYPFYDEINSKSANIDDWEAGLLLPCMLYHLEFVKIIGVQGCINELKFLEILLKNAMVLKTVVLYLKCECPGDMKWIMNFSEKLLTFPRASSNVAFMFF
ncbi:F-box domain [Macleaya cordata]|uniref:F-box domain n=1 Tax=Macleaya cordata TaxID=56857 RepID=A0A200QBF0_MACCD|nr:F-box domain [Macleaya cordata]